MPDTLRTPATAREITIVTAIDQRDASVEEYDLHVECLEQMIASYADLPDEWPEHLAHLRGRSSPEIARAVSDEDLELAARLHHRDIIRADRRMAFIERNKTTAHRTALKTLIDPERAKEVREERDAKPPVEPDPVEPVEPVDPGGEVKQ